MTFITFGVWSVLIISLQKSFVWCEGNTLALQELQVPVLDNIRKVTHEEFFVILGPTKELCDQRADILSTTYEELQEPVPPLYYTTDTEIKSQLSIREDLAMIFYRNRQPYQFWSSEKHPSVNDVAEWLHLASRASIHSMGDANFEHLTQAASGATTGDWLTLFYSPERCPELLARWGGLAVRLHGKMNALTIDADASPALVNRFNILRCPAILLFRRGKMYFYDVPQKDMEPLMAFAEGFYKNAPSKKVPVVPTPFDKLTDKIADWMTSLNLPIGPQALLFVCVSLGVGIFAVMFYSASRNASKAKDQ